jgi:hypothetical protein
VESRDDRLLVAPVADGLLELLESDDVRQRIPAVIRLDRGDVDDEITSPH